MPLFLCAMAVYAATRLIGLSEFPIFFFCDEALQATLGDQLLQHGLRDQTGTFLPPYFLNDRRWAVSLSVYVHLLPVMLFGKSVLVVRLTAALLSLLAPIAVAVALRQVFALRWWWSAPLVMAVLPVWFLHSRTAFEAAMTVSAYAGFLCFYLLYRHDSPLSLFLALLCAGATFYSYTAGQGLILVTGFLLALSDLRYHLRQNRLLILASVFLALLLASPYARYRTLHPGVVDEQLRVLHSYLVEPIPLTEKAAIFFRQYASGFSPSYWFWPDAGELIRHRIKDMAYVPLFLAPFVSIGILRCVRHWRSAAYRVLLIAPIGVPVAAAAANIQIMRVLAMIVPITFYACLGIEEIGRRAARYVPDAWLSTVLAAVLGGLSVALLGWSLRTGPTWYTDYSLYGLQWGSPQVFAAIKDVLRQAPSSRVLLSPTWANNPAVFLDFFLDPSERSRVAIGNVDAFLFSKQPLSGKDLLVMTPPEYERARSSKKLVLDKPERVLAYPDGKPGFYFVRMKYADGVDPLFAAEREARRRLHRSTVTLRGKPVEVHHSMLDMGGIPDLFDGNTATLIRGLEANPFILELRFSAPEVIRSVALDLGTMPFRLTVLATPSGGGGPVTANATYGDLGRDPHVRFRIFESPRPVEALRLEILNLNDGETTHVHVRELALR